jgi:hypothetical protein
MTSTTPSPFTSALATFTAPAKPGKASTAGIDPGVPTATRPLGPDAVVMTFGSLVDGTVTARSASSVFLHQAHVSYV